jgi:sulfide:quinone oxidoreductase
MIRGKEKHMHLTRKQFIRLTAATAAVTASGAIFYRATRSTAKGKIVIVGGGAAGLSVAAQLSRALLNPDITVIDPSDRHYYQPGFTLIASGIYAPDSVWKNQKDCIPSGVKWVKDSVALINPDKKTVTTNVSGTLTYDFLVLAPGLQINWSRIEGITQAALGTGNAHSIYDFTGAQRTWTALQGFAKKGGKAIFTDTHTKHKCGGAPKKICLLTDDYMRHAKTRKSASIDFYTASKHLYDVPFYTPRLEAIYAERQIPIHLHTRVKAVDTLAKKVYLEQVKLNDDKTQTVTPLIQDYDFLHFTPPQTAPDFVVKSGLSWSEGPLAAEGWAMTDKKTLLHAKYPNIVCLGDVAGIPTSKTSAAIRKQAPIAVANLLSIMENKAPVATYNGYAACPIITEYGKLILCEFDYDKKPCPSFPFTLLDTSKELREGWWLKVYVLKPLYFYGMLTGLA